MKHYLFNNKSEKNFKEKVFCSIGKCFKISKMHQQWIRNFFDEHFLSQEVMEELCNIIYKNIDKDCDECRDRLIEHGYNSLCDGGLCKLKKTSYTVGSLIPRKSFKNYLIDNYISLFKSKNEIENFIINLCINPIKVNPKYKDISLRKERRIIWMTWDSKKVHNNPFSFLNTSYAEEARTALGLGFDNYKGEDFLAFIFNSRSTQMLRPTICDSGFNDFFRPTPIMFDQHGVIEPLNNGYYEILGETRRISREGFMLPESVCWGDQFKVQDLKQCKLLNSI
jgi:hypothetical protein